MHVAWGITSSLLYSTDAQVFFFDKVDLACAYIALVLGQMVLQMEFFPQAFSAVPSFAEKNEAIMLVALYFSQILRQESSSTNMD